MYVMYIFMYVTYVYMYYVCMYIRKCSRCTK